MKKRLFKSIVIPLLLVAVLVGVLNTSASPCTPAVQARPLFPGNGVYTTFLSLTDTPYSYSGETGRVPVVNSGETALDFASGLYWDDVNDRLGIGIAPTSILQASEANEGATNIFAFENTNNTNAASHARVKVLTGGASGGNPYVQMTNSVDNWVFGLDNSDADKFKIANWFQLDGTDEYFTIDTAGNVGVQDVTPSYPLDVAGTIRAQDDLRADDDLFVTDDATVGGGLQIDASLNVDGPASVDGLTVTGDAGISGDVEAESQLFQGRASSANDPSNMLLGLDNSAGGAMLWAHDNLWYAETIFDDEDAIGPRYVLYVRWIAYNKTHSDYQQGTAILTPGDHVTLYQRAGPPRVDLSLYFGIYEDYDVIVLQPVLPEDHFRVVIWAMWLSD